MAVFLALALWPLWSARFPPMQDYPAHLAYVQALREHGRPGSDFDRYFEFRFHPVYATFYVVTIALAEIVPIEIAGKLALSLDPLLVALVVARLGRRAGGGTMPWGALLFFPLAFNPAYFFGNVAFLFSLPMLVLALLDLDEYLAADLDARTLLAQLLWQVALVITHPMTFLAYLALAIAGAIARWKETPFAPRKLGILLAIGLALLGAAALAERGTQLADAASFTGISWASPALTLTFFAYMFDGMQAPDSAELATVAAWTGVLAVLVASCVVAWRERAFAGRQRVLALYVGLALLAMFALPFQFGAYAFLNVRIACIVYFLLALGAARLPVRAPLAACLTGLAAVCMIASIAKQARLSAETREIVPVIGAIPPHARVLPLTFDSGSPELDRSWFTPHKHECGYYHAWTGGGFDPYLIGSPVDPMRPRPGEWRPAPPIFRPDAFRWELHGADYEYVLTRGTAPGAREYLRLHADEIAAHGAWTLYKRRPD